MGSAVRHVRVPPGVGFSFPSAANFAKCAWRLPPRLPHRGCPPSLPWRYACPFQNRSGWSGSGGGGPLSCHRRPYAFATAASARSANSSSALMVRGASPPLRLADSTNGATTGRAGGAAAGAGDFGGAGGGGGGGGRGGGDDLPPIARRGGGCGGVVGVLHGGRGLFAGGSSTRFSPFGRVWSAEVAGLPLEVTTKIGGEDAEETGDGDAGGEATAGGVAFGGVLGHDGRSTSTM